MGNERQMAARRARLLAGRQAKKEYSEAKHAYLRKNKPEKAMLDKGYYDSDQDSNKDDEVLAIESESDEDNKIEEQSSEEGNTSGAETSSSEDIVPRLKPVFTRKKDRLTLEDEEAQQQKQADREKEATRKAEERREYTLSVVKDEIAKEKESNDYKQTKTSINSLAKAMAELDTNDEDEEQGFKKWKLREFDRLKREKAIRDEELQIEEDRARRAEMRESDLLAEALERKEKKDQNPEVREKQKFLQRYYHKGAYFQDDEELVAKMKARGQAPTLEDKFDRSVVPEVMQSKYFGKRSQSKHTHLSKEDTSRRDAWGQNAEDDRRTKIYNEPKKK